MLSNNIVTFNSRAGTHTRNYVVWVEDRVCILYFSVDMWSQSPASWWVRRAACRTCGNSWRCRSATIVLITTSQVTQFNNGVNTDRFPFLPCPKRPSASLLLSAFRRRPVVARAVRKFASLVVLPPPLVVPVFWARRRLACLGLYWGIRVPRYLMQKDKGWVCKSQLAMQPTWNNERLNCTGWVLYKLRPSVNAIEAAMSVTWWKTRVPSWFIHSLHKSIIRLHLSSIDRAFSLLFQIDDVIHLV